MKIIYFLLLFGFLSYTQNHTGIINYKYTPNEISKEERADKKELYSVMDRMNESARNINFRLIFMDERSYFGIDDFLTSDLKPGGLNYAKNVIINGDYYFNSKSNELLRTTEYYSDNTLIKSISDQKKWQLFNETKKIGPYKCFKATMVKTVINGSGEHHFNIVAWYTNEIPVPFGPKEYNNLPGLILELVDRSFTFYATQITIGTDIENVKKPKSNRIITEDEHLERLLKFSNDN
jgi:GLPGLI family protein